MLTVKFKMAPGCEDLEPKKAHPDDAAFDLRAREDAIVGPGRVGLIPTGLFLELPPECEAQVRPRSGLALKQYIAVLNSPGTIDAGYRGEVSVILFNAGQYPFEIRRGDRIAQMVIQTLPRVCMIHSTELSDSERGKGGFGSTGK